MSSEQTSRGFLRRVVRAATSPEAVAWTVAGYVVARALAGPTTRALERQVVSKISHNVPNPLPARPLHGTQYHGRPLRFLIIGDSLGAGATAIDPELQEWPEAILPGALAERIAHRRKRPVELLAMAEVGDKHKGLSTQLQWAVTEIQARERESFTSPKVDLVLIIAGSNDVRDPNYKTVDLVDSSLRNCIAKLHNQFGQPAIAVVECPLLTTAPATDNGLVRLALNPRAREIRAVQRQVVSDFQRYGNAQVRLELIEVDDITTGLRADDGAFVAYDIHPTGPGQQSFARHLVDGKLGEMVDGIQTFSGTQRLTVVQRSRRIRKQRESSGVGPRGHVPRRLAEQARNASSRSRSAGS